MTSARVRGPRLPSADNYRGERLPVTLGIALALAATGMLSILGAAGHEHRRLLWVLPGLALVLAAGLYDDYRPGRTRGVRAQVMALATGRVRGHRAVMLKQNLRVILLTAAKRAADGVEPE